MDCERAKELIVEFLYDELPAEPTSELRDHLAECEDCLKYKDGLQRTLECLDQAEELRAPVDLAALHDAIERKRHRVWRSLGRRWPVWVTVGTCFIMLSMFTLFASEIRYEDNALTIRFNGRGPDPVSERTANMLAAYREDQLRFQNQLSGQLRSSVATLLKVIDEYESQRDKQITSVLQQMQRHQYQMLVATREELETLALQTEDEFKRSYLTMAAMAELVESQ